jgi:DNA-directed RNA polymerase sigma subunit (sigma70/sigma32)
VTAASDGDQYRVTPHASSEAAPENGADRLAQVFLVEQVARRLRIGPSGSRAQREGREPTPIRRRPTSRIAVSSASLQSELQLYLRQIDGEPLLTAEEERELGWRIINDGDIAAKDRMIKANLRLVIAIAKHFASRGVPLPDLIEEGNVGLIRAVEGFDPAQGTRFSTYAAWWIKQAIRRMLTHAVQPIHVPAYMVELIQRLRETSRQLEERLARRRRRNWRRRCGFPCARSSRSAAP